jgi:hypothetical protein
MGQPTKHMETRDTTEGVLDATPPALLRPRNTGHTFWTFESSGSILRQNGGLLKSKNSPPRLCSDCVVHSRHANGGSVGDRGKGERIQHATTKTVGLPLLAAPATGSWQSAKDRARANGAKPTMRFYGGVIAPIAADANDPATPRRPPCSNRSFDSGTRKPVPRCCELLTD